MLGQKGHPILARARYLLFETFCYPTVRYQTALAKNAGGAYDFSWFVLVDPGVDPTVIDDMRSLLTSSNGNTNSHQNAYLILTEDPSWAADGVGIPNVTSYGAGFQQVARAVRDGTVELLTGNATRLIQTLERDVEGTAGNNDNGGSTNTNTNTNTATNESDEMLLVIETMLDADDGLNNRAIEWIQDLAVAHTRKQQEFEREKNNNNNNNNNNTVYQQPRPTLNSTWWLLCGTDHIEWHNRDVFRLTENQYKQRGISSGIVGLRHAPQYCASAGFTRVGLTTTPSKTTSTNTNTNTNTGGSDIQQQEHGSGLLAAAVFFGMLLGGLVVGAMGDWIGRKPMLLLGLLCNSVAGIASALAPDVYTLAFLRCVAGLGIGATVPPLFTLATELAPPSARGFCVTVCASFWMVGSIYVALVALWCFGGDGDGSGSGGDGDGSGGDDNTATATATTTAAATTAVLATWRIFALICAVPSALGAALVYLLVPESPRFLGLEGRSVEAVGVANSLVQKMNGHHHPVGSATAVPPLTIAELEGTFPSSALRTPEIRNRQRQRLRGSDRFDCEYDSEYDSEYERSDAAAVAPGFLRRAALDFVRSTSKLYEPNLKHTTWPLQLVWFSLSFGTYGLLTWINIIFREVRLENIYSNALLFAAANLPGNLLTAFFMDRIGRSASLVGSIACASASLLSFALAAVRVCPTGIVLGACLFQCFTAAAWNTIDTMTSELFPTPVRSTGLGVCAASGRIGAMIAQFVNSALLVQTERVSGNGDGNGDGDHPQNPVRLLLVASGTLLLGALTPCFLPGGGDMTGRPVHDDLQLQLHAGSNNNNNNDDSNDDNTTTSRATSERQRLPKVNSNETTFEFASNSSGSSSTGSAREHGRHRGNSNMVHRTTRRRYSEDEVEGE